MFRFKRFTINQDRTPMKVGTDGVLLGAWVNIYGEERRILDIGTGTGVIALMMAQRSEASVDGVEIDEASALQATENVEASPWSERVSIHHTEIQGYRPNERYDLIVSNPPYFVDSLTSPDSGRTTARHTTQLSFTELVDAVARLLGPDGRFAIILPTQESQLFDVQSHKKLHLHRRCNIHSREGGEVKRVMSEYKLGDNNTKIEPEEISIERDKRHDYTDEYRKLTGDFYLKF